MNDIQLISHGAEAKIYKIDDKIIKYRLSKPYRLPEIDKMLIERRTRSESNILNKLFNNGVKVPKIFKDNFKDLTEKLCEMSLTNFKNEFNLKNTIFMQFIEGITLKEFTKNLNICEKKMIYERLGKLINTMHNFDIIHGDITTLNFIVKDNEIYAIDFGLSYVSKKDENKAVDLYVFEKAIICSQEEEVLESFYKGYNNEIVLNKLNEVRRRGRKREENAIG
ncbi:TP53 regulating kinase [Gurleya vavrai]